MAENAVRSDPSRKKPTGNYPGVELHHQSREQNLETEAVVFGFWMFLMSDLITFGLILATYITSVTPMGVAGGPGPRQAFDMGSVFAQTVLLLLSSLLYGMSTAALKYARHNGVAVAWMLAATATGAAFLWLGVDDLMTLLDRGWGPSRSNFLSAYFLALGLHAMHIAATVVWTLLLIAQVLAFGFKPLVIRTRQLRLGLMWHLLNIVWIGIVSVVFLAGVA